MKRLFFSTIICIGIVSILTIFFFLYSLLPLASQHTETTRLNSPDETANYFFSATFAKEGVLSYKEPFLEESKGYIHPRSMTASPRGDTIVPVAFLGMPLIHGVIAKLFGMRSILFVTPFVGVLASLFFYLLLIRIFPRFVACTATLLFLAHPAYWYNANRAMLPNTLFVDFLIIGAALTIIGLSQSKIQEKNSMRIRSILFSLLGGLCTGLALMIRLSEAIWVVGVYLFLGIILMRRIAWRRTVVWAVAGAVPIGVLLYWNLRTYGHPLFFGYQTGDILPAVQAFDNAIDVVRTFDGRRLNELSENIQSVGNFIFRYLMPFGFHPQLFLANGKEYLIKLFWWLSIPSVIGFLYSLRSGWKELITKHFSPQILYSIVVVGIMSWLVPYYGSWEFYDNITREATIGNSYVRYWLMIYCLSTPFVAMTLHRFLRYAHGVVRSIGCALIVGVLMWFSFQSVLWQSEESIFTVAKNMGVYEHIAQNVIALTPQGSVIVSPRSDKIFFPNRKVAQQMDDFREISLLAPLAAKTSVYYYGFWDQKTAAFVTKKYFSPYRLKLEFVSDITEKEFLYKVVPL